MSNPKMKLENKKDVEFTLDTIGRPYITDSKVSYFEKHYRQNLNIEDYQSVKGNGCIHNFGSGKTTLLCNMVKTDLEADPSKPLVLDFTNKTVQNVKSMLGIKLEANSICTHSIAVLL